MPHRHRAVAAADGRSLAAASSGVRAPRGGDGARQVPGTVAAVEGADDDEAAELLVLGDAMAVDQGQLHARLGERLARIHVEEKSLVKDAPTLVAATENWVVRLVEDSDGRGDDAARRRSGLFATHPTSFVQHVHLDVHLCVQ